MDMDRAFVDVMVPHDQTAVEMAKIAQERAEHEELRTLADSIVSAQWTEIGQLIEWRRAWFRRPTLVPGPPALSPGRSTPTEAPRVVDSGQWTGLLGAL